MIFIYIRNRCRELSANLNPALSPKTKIFLFFGIILMKKNKTNFNNSLITN